MKRAHVLAIATVWIASMHAGCGNGTAPGVTSNTLPAGASGMGIAPPMGTGGTSTGGIAAPAGSPSTMTSSTGGTSAAAGGTSATPGNGGSVAIGNGGSIATGGAVGASGGSGGGGGAAAGGANTAGAAGAAGAPSAVIPTPVTAPLVWGFGIGITDVPAAVKFYTEVMKMTVEKDGVKRDDRTETTLYGTQAMRGARLVLMHFDDGRNTRKITAKVVWQSQNAVGINAAAAAYPDYVSRLNLGIVQFDGPETYIQEVGGVFDSGGAAITVPYPIALGFAVGDQPAARKFYTSLGMTESSLGSFSVTDVNGTGTIAEYSVKFTDGMGLVLQNWTPARTIGTPPVMAVMFVPDAKAMGDKIVAAGGAILQPAARSAAYDNRVLVVAKDLDGYVLELVE
ncbi:MAG TPA: hypothetical protein VH062_32455 [Polyangiaceae bacterium]|jgi:catechol 2,3-dioxygenase-like lactoylglutathione lyase family enzyme|nr:hypothetical protein [Polyangiaceae bacterium]